MLIRYVSVGVICIIFVFFFKQKTAYEMRISDWSSDVCSSDLLQFLLLMARQRAANGAIDADLKIGEAARGGKGAVDALDNLQRVGKAIVKPCENPEFI